MRILLKLYYLILLLISNFSYGSTLFTLSDSLESEIYFLSDTTMTEAYDSTAVVDTTMKSAQTVNLIPVKHISNFNKNEYSTTTNRNDFSKEDYRTTSNLFTYLPYGFLQDLGQLGQPSEQMFYGLGFGYINFSRDGIRLNNPWQNSYDLNKIMFERIDSIEIAPLPRGFLFDLYNNPVSVLFHSQDYFSNRPITRLKFYQASYDEGFIDLLFHTYITKRLDLGIGLTVSGIDSRFYNSDYESWKLNGRLGYMISNDLFIRANYYFVKDSLALNGGLPSSVINNGVYSDVLYRDRYQLTTNHFADVKVLANLFSNFKSDITFYYQVDRLRFRQNPDTTDENIPTIIDNNSYQTIGIGLLNDYKNKYLNLIISANYEITKYSLDIINANETQNIISAAGQLQFSPFGSIFIPSIYTKYSNYNNRHHFGFGTDLNISLNKHLILYGGISFYSKLQTIMERFYMTQQNLHNDVVSGKNKEDADVKISEIGSKFKFDVIEGNLSYFLYSNSNSFKPILKSDTLLVNEISLFDSYSQTISGFNFLLKLNLWKFQLTSNTTYYLTSSDDKNFIAHPNYLISGKLYYIDQLFNNNLKLRTGVNFRITGDQPYFIYDFEKSMQARFVTNTAGGYDLIKGESVPQSIQFDLFFAGTIQDAATIFIVLENILDTEYYIVPYYYKQPQMLRLGVSWSLYD